MPRTRRAHPGSNLLVTAAFWLLAALLVAGGMAFDARGSFLASLFLFLLASAALVAPLALSRRTAARGGEPTRPPPDDDVRA